MNMVAHCLMRLVGIVGGTPGQRYNLSGWKLQTCLETPKEVFQPELSNYSDANFFLGTGGTISLRTPDNASGITVHASHPCTELRETGVPDWGFGGTHTLSASCAVMRVSNTTGKTIIAQVHGSVDEEQAEVLKLQYARGKSETVFKKHNIPECRRQV